MYTPGTRWCSSFEIKESIISCINLLFYMLSLFLKSLYIMKADFFFISIFIFIKYLCELKNEK